MISVLLYGSRQIHPQSVILLDSIGYLVPIVWLADSVPFIGAPTQLPFVEALRGCSFTAERLLILGRISEELGLLSIGCLRYFGPVVDAELTGFGAIEPRIVVAMIDVCAEVFERGLHTCLGYFELAASPNAVSPILVHRVVAVRVPDTQSASPIPKQAYDLIVHVTSSLEMVDLHLNPYADVDWNEVERHKAQLHAHTSYPEVEGHSGSDPPEVVIDDYREAGYTVLALTGHEYNIEEPTWPWTDWNRDPADLGMVAVQAAELGNSDGGIDHDLLCLFADVAATTGMSVHEVLDIIADRGGVAVFPHPSRSHRDGSWYVEYFRDHPHLLGVEVVNAADRYPTDRDVWDDLQERLGNERPVWGFANDDYHGRDQDYAFDRSRNVVLVDELTLETVREALVDGRFLYQHVVADEPPVVDAIRHESDRGELAVEARGWEEIQWASEGGIVDRGPRLRYREVDIGSYVRARLITETGSETGTQPFLLA